MSDLKQLYYPHQADPQRLDLFVGAQLPGVSRSQIKRLIDAGQVLVDGSRARASTRLRGGEMIAIHRLQPRAVAVQPEAIPLRVLYEDSDLIVIDKPAGMVVHPAAGHPDGTLVNALLHHCGDLSGIGGELRPGIVHRLDKDTSGVLVATKNDSTHLALSRLFHAHQLERRYLALAHGLVTPASGRIELAIGRDPNHRLRMSSRGRHLRQAITNWRLLASFPEDRLSLLELRLETGRTHQIRVHLSERGHPLVQDPLYGGRARSGSLQDVQLRQLTQALPGQALHARLLGFVHPSCDHYREFRSEPPAAFTAVLDYLYQKYALTPEAFADE